MMLHRQIDLTADAISQLLIITARQARFKMNWICQFCVICFLLMIGSSAALFCDKSICNFELIVRHEDSMIYRAPLDEGPLPLAFPVILNGDKLQVTTNNFHIGGPFIGKVVNASDVHTVDGYMRRIITINGQFPGPNLEVMEGATVS